MTDEIKREMTVVVISLFCSQSKITLVTMSCRRWII